MCVECERFVCPGACPNKSDYGSYDSYGRVEEDYCELCGRPVSEVGEIMTVKNGSAGSKYYCLDCVGEFDIDDVTRVCGIIDVYELLGELGCKFRKN